MPFHLEPKGKATIGSLGVLTCNHGDRFHRCHPQIHLQSNPAVLHLQRSHVSTDISDVVVVIVVVVIVVIVVIVVVVVSVTFAIIAVVAVIVVVIFVIVVIVVVIVVVVL